MKTIFALLAILPFTAQAEFDPNPGRYWGSEQQYRDDNARIEQQRQTQQMQERMEEQRQQYERQQQQRQYEQQNSYDSYGDRYQ